MYYGLQYGVECWCGSAGDDFAKHGEGDSCTMTCGGSDDMCGGYDHMSVYEVEGSSSSSYTVSNPTPRSL